MADGRSVTTIEGLALRWAKLHPMQQAFVDHDALQCGDRTPGQIMSAVACVQEGHAGSDAEVREYMSGNLCRCGAYPYIVAAVRAVASAGSVSHAPVRLPPRRRRRRRARDLGGQAAILAGGTTMVDLMKLEVMTPSAVVDITGITELAGFDTSGDPLRFGALARMADVARDPVLVADYPCLFGSLLGGGIAAAQERGDPCRQPAAAHPLLLFP